jgi:molecular chaperone DnaK
MPNKTKNTIKELIEAKNNLSALSYSLEKTINDFKDKITDEEKTEAEEIIKKIKEDTAKEDVSIEEINTDKEKLTDIINKLSSKIYSQQNTQEQNNQESSDNSENTDNQQDNGEGTES